MDENKQHSKEEIFEQQLQTELDKLPYTKHLDDGQYNDGVLTGFELGARWNQELSDAKTKALQEEIERLQQSNAKLIDALEKAQLNVFNISIKTYIDELLKEHKK